jgi:DNA-binding CsgD family transcriptional regulator
MRPQGWRHAVSLCFWGESPAGLPVFVTSVNRREGRRDFARTDLARLARVHPFLDCAVNRILEREAATTVRDGIALAAHDGTHGVAVLDSHFLLVQANPGALELCAGWAVDDTERTPKSDAAPDWRLPSALVAACRGLHEEWQTLIRSDPDTSFRRHRQLVHPSVPGLTARVTMVAPSATSLAGPSFVVELDRRIDAEEPFVPVLQKLTTAERAVAVVVADGLSNQEISERLGKSVEAVKFLLHRIFQKTGVSSRAALVAALRSRPHMRSVTD